MVAGSMLPHAEFGPNEHWEDAPHFTKAVGLRRTSPWNPDQEQRLFGLNKKESHKDGWSGDLTEIQMDEMVEKWNEDISKLQNMTSSNRVTSSCSSGNR